ncbi:MAG: DUF4142 domain-containing protein, partial [Bacteriovorax sp.]
QIAAVVVSANTVDVDAGRFAMNRSKNPKVKSFAQMMITDHTSVNKSAVDLVTKLKVTPEKNESSKGLDKEGKENITALSKLNGASFDKAYVDHEITYHQAVLDTIDKTLIPNSSNPELRALLVKTRPVIAAHLEHAKELAMSLR